MSYAAEFDGAVALGGLYFLIFIGGAVALILWLERKYGAKIRQKKRDREIKTAMLFGLYDGEAQERIAREIIEERRGRDDFEY